MEKIDWSYWDNLMRVGRIILARFDLYPKVELSCTHPTYILMKDNIKGEFSVGNYYYGNRPSQCIVLNYKYPEDAMNTILHEIAHSIEYNLYGKLSNHGKQWQTIAKAIGVSDDDIKRYINHS